MREIERRATVKRRVFLRGSAVAPMAAAVASMGFTAESAWAQAAKTLSPHVMATLARTARDIFPHDHITDKFYIIAVAGYDDIVAGDAAKRAMLEGGVARLDEDAANRFKVANYLAVGWEADRVTLLQGITETPFFAKLRGDLVVTLYNQKELWAKFGYEGSSAEHGGYIHRGFNDIDWLPTA